MTTGRWEDARIVGSCQGCSDGSGRVYVIEARHWVTRLCSGCLKAAKLKAVSR